MARNKKYSELELHKKWGVDLFNGVWKLMGKKRRTPAEGDAMLHAAHASRHHWGQFGKAVNLARGEWQISRVYCVLRRPEPALFHAQRCLDICRKNAIGDFDLAYAYEALARASAIGRKKADLSRYRTKALACGKAIREKEDREFFEKDMATVPK